MSDASAILYPILGVGTLYLRDRRLDSRIRPGRTATAWLWICGLAVAVISPAAVLNALLLQLTS
ncbi:MAG: hypothetical protein MK538_06065 [Planctomycetes bacterium]|nr:hypothetical protein [Planctomycetota bacterium]